MSNLICLLGFHKWGETQYLGRALPYEKWSDYRRCVRCLKSDTRINSKKKG